MPAAGGLVILAVWTAYFLSFSRIDPGLTQDSSVYIDCARSIVEGKGFLERTSCGMGPQVWSPMGLFPPGYPVLIAGFMKLGLSPYSAALAVAFVAAVVSATAIAYLCARLLTLHLGFMLTLLTISMPAFVYMGGHCLSDAPYTMVLLLSLVCMVRATDSRDISPRWIWLAGALAGFAWCIRYVGVALIAASFVYLVCYVLFFQRRRRNVFAMVAWGAGCLCGSGWLIVRNLRTFGAMTPYKMPPSDRPLLVNLQDAYNCIVTDILGVKAAARIATGTYGTILLGMGVLVVLGVLLRGRTSRRFKSVVYEKRHLLLLAGLAFCHIATVVVGRTVYQWAELINPRYLCPVYWVLLLLIVNTAIGVGARIGLRQRTVVAVLVFCLAAGVSIQVRRQFRILHNDRPWRADWITREEAEELSQEVRHGKMVLCDTAYILTVYSDIDARYPLAKPWEGVFTREDIEGAWNSDLLWGIIVANKSNVENGRYGEFLKSLVDRSDSSAEFDVSTLSKGGLVLRYRDTAEEADSSPHLADLGIGGRRAE